MTRLGSDSKTRTPTRLSITLKSTASSSLKDTIPLKELVAKKKRSLSLESAMSSFISLDVSTLNALRSRPAGPAPVDLESILTVMELRLFQTAETVA